ncbi:hypothetical protein AQUSIP_24500 [Aquicella siphonis]|uniref:Uncharacterized protein n=1 Tax=Aquicella siphonis TaxID=254247 RepID=A0A5E4PLD2_9COXI|nr:HAD family hydrolase [Aquicella siphonis]VVC77123.1 hypothetical protein AQUSIP_24500 [Aquicella siphonis]
MESAVTPDVTHQSQIKSQARAEELISILEHYAQRIKVLSLDCFDTLIWRQTATPSDAFFDMQKRPAFQAAGLTARLRAQAEENARQKMLIDHGSTEVKLTDIYKANNPSLSNHALAALAEDELATEQETCFAFPPVVELIRQARARGLKIIIVSDTYFSEPELRRLLESCLPQDVLQSIRQVFCSSEHGVAKSSGLFSKVCNKIHENPHSILHVGDNLLADFVAPQTIGIHSIHFIHNEKKVGETIRMQALAGGFIDPAIRHERSLVNPFRGIFAASRLSEWQTESLIGYLSAGPVMYAFARYICAEVEKLQLQGKRPKVLFLMRDAYLPSLACETLAGREIGKRVRISRFAAFASSFRNKDDIDKYLCDNVASLRFYDICRQLLLPEAIAGEISEKAATLPNPALAFIKLIHQDHILTHIFKASKAYRQRLIRHLEREVGLEKGDTLVFVDLGYTGTAQRKLEPVFRDEMAVEIVGRYLISLSVPGWEKSRGGLMDPSWCDDRTLQTLVAYIALLEQICTSNEKSVVDYDTDGSPIYSETSVSKAQHAKLETIQSECLRFIQDAVQFFSQARIQPSNRVLRDTAMAELARMLFFPSAAELDYLKSFEFDLNMGTKDLLNVLDPEKGLTGLRRRGLFFMEKNLKSMRTNYPAELRSAGMELALTLMAQHRIGFDVRVSDLSLRRENLNVIAIRAGNASQTMVAALPTHDGYFSLIVPVGTGDFQVGVQFGLNYQWVQLESIELIVTSALYTSKESEHTVDASENIVVDQMENKGQGLYECLTDTSLLVYIPTRRLGEHHHALRIVFRPIIGKKKNRHGIQA